METDEFEKLVRKAIREIPAEFLEKIKNVDIVVADFPDRNQIQKLLSRGDRGLLLGLYEGIPQTRRSYYTIGGNLPDKITLFRVAILQISNEFIDVENIVKDTIIHEIAHHFGIDDTRISELKRKVKP